MSLLSRALEKIAFSDGCWLWTGARARNGYGQIKQGARGTPTLYAHRVVYEALVGPIPKGLTIDHLCRVRSCVKPAHLEPVTLAENILRGECLSAKRARQTHCKNGHELAGANLVAYYARHGRRICRICHNAYGREHPRRRKA